MNAYTLVEMKETVDFGAWLLDQLESRHWSQADMARRTGLSRTVISFFISGKRNPEAASLTAIADALDLPREHVLKVAGVLQEANEVVMSDDAAEMLQLFVTLSSKDRRELVELARIKKNFSKLRELSGDQYEAQRKRHKQGLE